MKSLFIFIALFPLFATARPLLAVREDSAFVRENFTKHEVLITMRDGVKLFTSIYVPVDISEKNTYPFLLQRTCFGSAPYGLNNYTKLLYYSPHMMREKFIFVKQDVRGRYMSEGSFTNTRPLMAVKTSTKDVDESTDAFDTIEWLLKNIPHNNGKAGLYGISYAGFYAMAGALSGHPAIKAVSPQAPVSDFFFEDFHHNGAFVLAVAGALPVFGVQPPKATTAQWFMDYFPEVNTTNGFDWYKSMIPLSKLGKLYLDNFFWNEIVRHPDYDEFWQQRSLIPHLKATKNLPPVLNVGGWFDAEDMTGVLDMYKNNRSGSPNILIMGPFGHGNWTKEQGHHLQGNLYFGDSLATFFQRNIELVFFRHYLKTPGLTALPLPKATLFDTGRKEWRSFGEYPLAATENIEFFLSADGKLSRRLPEKGFREYLSDPHNPVPYAEGVDSTLDFLQDYMYADQRFVAGRTDVLTFETAELTEELTLTGEIMARINFSTTCTDADFFVKLIDVYPQNEPVGPFTPAGVKPGGYQQMVRSEIMRARFRNSFSASEALIPDQKTELSFRLQDIFHTFKKGHKIMVQVQSSAFPLFDLNPQKYVPNIYQATESDFQKATHRIYSDSKISLQVLTKNNNGKYNLHRRGRGCW